MRFLDRILLSAALLGVAAAPCLAQSGSFGSSVLVGDDELIIAEPTTFFRPGTVYIYRRAARSWEEATQLQAPAAERADGFGTVLAVADGTLFVGQRHGPIHTFERADEGWRYGGEVPGTQGIGVQPPEEPTEVPVGCNQYGYCRAEFGVTLAASGDWLFVGEPRAESENGSGSHQDAVTGQVQDDAGVVHVFRRGADGAWTREAILRSADPEPGDGFGTAIALGDGRALIGAPYLDVVEGDARSEAAGRVFVFELEDGEWRQTAVVESRAEANANFGATIAVSGDMAVIGAPNSGDGHGVAFVYSREVDTGVWAEQSRLAAFHSVRGDRFGSAIAIDDEGVWVGAPAPRGDDTGMVYVYLAAADGTGFEDARRIRLDETVARDEFGDRIVVQRGLATVTASGMHHQAGAVYVYERDAGGEWQEQAVLLSPPDALPALVGDIRECADGMIGPFACEDVDLLAFMPTSMLTAPENARGVRTNDNWGWTDPETGREYALVGRNDGTSFVDITDPTNPVLIGDLPKTPNTPRSQLWRDIKVYENHAFVVADGAGAHGMQVFDLTRLRDVQDAPALFEPDTLYTLVNSVHNIVINEESGFAYAVGARAGGETCGGGLHMIDIREPKDPQFAGCFRDELTGRGPSGGYTHDAQCVIYRGPDARYQGHEICLNANVNMLSIADVTDKENPVAVARASYPNPGYLHQGWLTEDHRYFLMDDEADVLQGHVPTTRTTIWDLSDLEDPVLVKEFMGSMPASAHNLYVKDDIMYQANYRYGLHVIDVSDPLEPVEIGHFNTTPHLSGPGFSGAWSNYPFYDSGSIIVTSLQEGLFIVRKRPRDPEVTS